MGLCWTRWIFLVDSFVFIEKSNLSGGLRSKQRFGEFQYIFTKRKCRNKYGAVVEMAGNSLLHGLTRAERMVVPASSSLPRGDTCWQAIWRHKKCASKDLERNFTDEFSHQVIFPPFSIDNTKGSSDEGIIALKLRIWEALKQEPYMGEQIPFR